MSEYVDLLIMNNDLVLDPARQPCWWMTAPRSPKTSRT